MSATIRIFVGPLYGDKGYEVDIFGNVITRKVQS